MAEVDAAGGVALGGGGGGCRTSSFGEGGDDHDGVRDFSPESYRAAAAGALKNLVQQPESEGTAFDDDWQSAVETMTKLCRQHQAKQVAKLARVPGRYFDFAAINGGTASASLIEPVSSPLLRSG